MLRGVFDLRADDGLTSSPAAPVVDSVSKQIGSDASTTSFSPNEHVLDQTHLLRTDPDPDAPDDTIVLLGQEVLDIGSHAAAQRHGGIGLGR